MSSRKRVLIIPTGPVFVHRQLISSAAVGPVLLHSSITPLSNPIERSRTLRNTPERSRILPDTYRSLRTLSDPSGHTRKLPNAPQPQTATGRSGRLSDLRGHSGPGSSAASGCSVSRGPWGPLGLCGDPCPELGGSRKQASEESADQSKMALHGGRQVPPGGPVRPWRFQGFRIVWIL